MATIGIAKGAIQEINRLMEPYKLKLLSEGNLYLVSLRRPRHVPRTLVRFLKLNEVCFWLEGYLSSLQRT